MFLVYNSQEKYLDKSKVSLFTNCKFCFLFFERDSIVYLVEAQIGNSVSHFLSQNYIFTFSWTPLYHVGQWESFLIWRLYRRAWREAFWSVSKYLSNLALFSELTYCFHAHHIWWYRRMQFLSSANFSSNLNSDNSCNKRQKKQVKVSWILFPLDTYFIPPKLVKQSPCLHMEISHTHKIALYG
jgi:hypothetical protein